jgi:hypothetical protein
MAVAYDRGHCCKSCRDVLRACCGRDDGDSPLTDGLCCECAGDEHTASRPAQITRSVLSRYL